jgi:hypothetical protein
MDNLTSTNLMPLLLCNLSFINQFDQQHAPCFCTAEKVCDAVYQQDSRTTSIILPFDSPEGLVNRLCAKRTSCRLYKVPLAACLRVDDGSFQHRARIWPALRWRLTAASETLFSLTQICNKGGLRW